MMRHGRLTIGIAAAIAFFFSLSGSAQVPPAADLVPPGFKFEIDQTVGAMRMIRASKAHENVPKPHMDPGMELEISWNQHPMVDQMLEMMAAQPEDPGQQLPGSVSREEPCGKEPFQGGFLRCRKTITPWVGSGKGPDLVLFHVSWAGKSGGGLAGVGVSRYCGSKEGAVGLIGSVISKLTSKS